MSDDVGRGRDGAVAGEPVLGVSDLHVSYDKIIALRGISLSVDRGEVVSIIGPNGAGKSTFADTVAGFLDYDGEITYLGTELGGRSPATLVEAGLVYCTEKRDLFGHMTVRENLRIGSYRRGENVDERLEYVYDLFPRLEEREEQEAATMSGGEQQMLAIGRSLMSDPEVLLLDEPTIGLAPVILEDISEALEEISTQGVTVVLCEQNVTFAMNHADRIYLLENGQIEFEGDPSTLRDDDYVRDAYLGE